VSLFRLLFSFDGTVGRRPYVAALAGVAVVFLTLIALSSAALEAIAAITAPRGWNAAFVLNALWSATGIIAVWSVLALMTKRLRAIGRSPWLAVGAVVPLVVIALINDAIFLVSRTLALPGVVEFPVLIAAAVVLAWVLVETMFLPSRS
jgi:uncharacterized membrane protein YhaH (DUF805 family)